jgi:orotate phosphoribosyltransferase
MSNAQPAAAERVTEADREFLARKIHEVGAVLRQPVVLSSGRPSNYYVNLRLLTLSPYLAAVVRVILRRSAEVDPVLRHIAIGRYHDTSELPITCMAGVLAAGAPLVAGCVTLADYPLKGLLIRREAKGHGTRDLIEGPYNERDVALLVDDVATSGDTFVHAARVLCDAGIRVAGALAILDRTGETGPRLAQFDVPFKAILTPRDLGIEE